MNMAWSQTPTSEPTAARKPPPRICNPETQRQCMDGSCVPRMELCPAEEEMLSKDTILIMIGVGMGVVVFLIVLYCLQQRRTASPESQDAAEEDDHPELLMPPPSYREAVNVYLYPPTLQTYRNRRMSSLEEPITPPPNYDTALTILAQSHESVLMTKDGAGPSSPTAGTSPVLRRTVSVEHVGISRCRPMTFSSFGANARTFTNTCAATTEEGT